MIKEAPACACHGEPMRWKKRPSVSRGGVWECRVGHRERERARYARDPSRTLKYQRAYYLRNRERELQRKRDDYKRRALILDRLKTFKGCARCGFRKHPAALVFHHLDPSTKTRNVSAFLRAGMDAVRKELSKCEVLCANCHALEHYA